MADMEGNVPGVGLVTAEMEAGSAAGLGVARGTSNLRTRANALGPGNPYRNIDLDETGVLVHAGTVDIYKIYIINAAAAVRYVKIYDHPDAPVAGDTPKATIRLAASSDKDWFYLEPWVMTQGLGLRATTGLADGDVGAPALNDIMIHVWYE